MKTRLLLAGVLLSLSTMVAQAQTLITYDRGGRIGTYQDKYNAIAASGEDVIVDGPCMSACTIVLSRIAPKRIYLTARAKFGFHAAWDFGPNGRPVTNDAATNMLYHSYPPRIRAWIDRHGGLTPRMIYLRGKQLAAMGYQRYSPRQSYADATPRW